MSVIGKIINCDSPQEILKQNFNIQLFSHFLQSIILDPE